MKLFCLRFYHSLTLIRTEDKLYIYKGTLQYTNEEHIIYVYTNIQNKYKLCYSSISKYNQLDALSHPNLQKPFLNLYDASHIVISTPITPKAQLLSFYLEDRPLSQKIIDQLQSLINFLNSKEIYLNALCLNSIFVDSQENLRCLPPFFSSHSIQDNLENNIYIDNMIFSAELIFSPNSRLTDQWLLDAMQYKMEHQSWPVSSQGFIFDILKEHLKHQKLLYQSRKNLTSERLLFKNLKNLKKLSLILKQENKKKKRNKRLKILTNTLPILIFTAILFLFYETFEETPNIITPDLKGIDIEDASLYLNQENIPFKIEAERYHNDYKKGEIIETKPAGLRTIKKNRLIRIYVSKGPLEIKVPNLIGRSVKETQLFLNDLDISFNEINQIHSYNIPEGSIIFQIPKVNQFIKQGYPIQVITSKGVPISLKQETKNYWLFFSKEPELLLHIPDIKTFGLVDINITQEYQSKSKIIWQGPHQFNEEFKIQFNAPYESFIKIYINGKFIQQFNIKKY